MRVKEKNDYAMATEMYSKKLELEEAQMLNRLQKTYQAERHNTELLNKMNDSSPVKLLNANK